MSKAPAFQFYPADWRKDPAVQSLSYEDRGIWFEILCIMHESSERGKLLLNGKKMPDEALARMLGLDKQNLTTTLTTLLDFGCARVEADTGVIYSKRMVEDERIRMIRKKAGKMGGNPRLLNQNPTTRDNQNPTTRDNQIPTPSSSSSSSDSNIVEKRLLDHLNEVSGKHFKPVDSNLQLLRARLREGHTEEEIRAVIDRKAQEWKGDPRNAQYLRPATVFGAQKFNQYVGELGQPLPAKPNGEDKPHWATLPRDDEKLWDHAKKHGFSNPGSLNFRQYRSRLLSEIEARMAKEGVN